MKGLKHYRAKEGMTQIELSTELGIPISSIAMYETGDRTPSLSRARKISNYFKVPIEELFFEKTNHEK